MTKENEIHSIMEEMCAIHAIDDCCPEMCRFYDKLAGCKNKVMRKNAEALYEEGYRKGQ